MSNLPPSQIFGVLTAIVTALTLTGARQILRSQTRTAPQTPDQLTTERRLEHLAETLRESARAMREVEAEIRIRREATEDLKKEADEAQRVASLNADARDAVQQLFRDELAVESRRNFRASLKVNILVFIAGVLATVAIALFVHPLH